MFPELVVPIRVSADDGGMTGEVFFAEFQAKCLCLFHGQAVVGCISWVKADDILVTFDITMLGVLAILAVCQQTGRCKREIAALKGVEQVGFSQLRSALFIQKLLSGERIVLVNEVRFDGGVVRVFRGDMLETLPYSSPRTFSVLSRNAVRSASSSRSFARICSVSAPPELKCLASWLGWCPPCCTGKQGGRYQRNFRILFLLAAGNNDRFLDLTLWMSAIRRPDKPS